MSSAKWRPSCFQPTRLAEKHTHIVCFPTVKPENGHRLNCFVLSVISLWHANLAWAGRGNKNEYIPTSPAFVFISSWWRHQMETLSALLAICAGNSPVTAEFPSQRPVTQSFDVFLLSTWTNGWVNNREAGDLRRHRAHYDVTVMCVTNGPNLALQMLVPCIYRGLHLFITVAVYVLQLNGAKPSTGTVLSSKRQCFLRRSIGHPQKTDWWSGWQPRYSLEMLKLVVTMLIFHLISIFLPSGSWWCWSSWRWSDLSFPSHIFHNFIAERLNFRLISTPTALQFWFVEHWATVPRDDSFRRCQDRSRTRSWLPNQKLALGAPFTTGD